jgi:hypothetical protein
MKRVIIASLILVMVLGIGLSYAAFNKQIPDNGKHETINFIGVPKDKSAPMQGSQGNTIFVPLNKAGQVPKNVQINVMRNEANPNKFEIIDRNATDDGEATILVPFEDYGRLSFNVYAIPLGKPGAPGLHVDAKFQFDDTVFDGDLLMSSFDIKREKGTPKVQDISDIFRASGWIDMNDNDIKDEGDVEFNNVWIFNLPELLSYYWDYQNAGLQHLQLRLYQTESGSYTIVPPS